MAYFQDYFTKLLRSPQFAPAKIVHDHALEFTRAWVSIKNTLMYPDERQLARGISSTDVPALLQSMVDSLVWESNRTEEGTTGACLEYLLKNDVLGSLVRLSETDRPSGIQAEVLRAVQNMVVMLDEQFLVHSAVHRAVLRLLRNCVGDEIQEKLDGSIKVMGAAKNVVKTQPSEYEEDLVNLLCVLCSRIRTFRELLIIFFHDKHWYRSEPLFAVEEEEEEEEEDEEDDEDDETRLSKEHSDIAAEDKSSDTNKHAASPTPSHATVTSAPASSVNKKSEYEFLLFNYLLRFVHREGQIGEFARAGVLFLMDVAMSPGEQIHRLADTKSSLDPPPTDPIADAALALAEYILDGDFSDVLAAGLGAVYSTLPSKLEFRSLAEIDIPESTGMVIGGLRPEDEDEREALEVAKDQRRAMGIEDASNPDFRGHLDHFLKLLEFIQDVLKRNTQPDGASPDIDPSALVGSAIAQSILDAIRRVFLENILYPSILECSDADGSAVAVMSYIEVMLCSLREGPLSERIVTFLTSEDNDEIQARSTTLDLVVPPQAKSSGSVTKESRALRRKSSAMMLLEIEAPDSRKQSKYFTSMERFTLKDLLLSNLRSQSQPTAASALQLLRSLLLQHPRLCQERLLIVVSDPHATSYPHPSITLPAKGSIELSQSDNADDNDDETFVYPAESDDNPSDSPDTIGPAFSFAQTTYSTHEREMDLYLALVSRVDPSHSSDSFSTGYEHYLHDALLLIQEQRFFQLDIAAEVRKALKHRLNANDAILSLVLESLRRFFFNSPELNIALTGVLATLAAHPDRSLAGWLTFAVDDAYLTTAVDQDDDSFANDGDDRSIDFIIEEKLSTESNILPASRMDQNSRPVVHSVFQGLVAQLDRYRQLIDDFDTFLLERRQGLLFSENLTDALTLALDLNDEPVVRRAKAEPPESPKPKRPTASSTASSIVSLFTPKKRKPVEQAPATTDSRARDGRSNVAASPFGAHYQRTGAISVEPLIAPVPAVGPWTPAKKHNWTTDEEDVFSSAWREQHSSTPALDEEEEENPSTKAAEVTLSQLLDNVVILEESIKELVAIIHARRCLGIDSIRYL